MKQRLMTAGLGALLVCGAATAIAAPGSVSSVTSGVGDVVSGDGNGPAASTSQASVGARTARQSPRPLSGTENTTDGGAPIVGDQDTLQGAESGGGAAQPAAQTGAGGGGGGSLPFTGYLAIPVLLLGAGMLGAGFVARRRAGGGLTA